MKKFVALFMAMLMLAGAACAEAPALESFTLVADSQIDMDLDGDGDKETLVWRRETVGEYDERAVLTVTDGGKAYEYQSDLLYQTAVYLSDVDGDGRIEIFLSGDEMSDDYVTFALRYTGGSFQQLRFADGRRGENEDQALDFGYGEVTAIDNGCIELTGSQDVLGTYFFSRTLSLKDDCFEFADDGLWRIAADIQDEELWKSIRALQPLRAIPAVFVDESGEETEGEIGAGERFVVTASDKTSVVWFAMEDGRVGHFGIAPSGDGWSRLVEGVPEGELFEMLPYAD